MTEQDQTSEWIECKNCGGQGEIHDPVRDGPHGYPCPDCFGEGGWHREARQQGET